MIGPAGGKHMNKNSLLKICDLTSEEIFHILEDAAAFSSSQSDWQFPRKTLVANLFLSRARGHISHLPARSISWAPVWKISLHREAAWKRVKACMTR